uniref:Uncharacterized protein n=1 Tax=Romanomermis culicivorax TaxID=13658 RepID=A0A915IW26_ROMCU
MPVGLFVAVDEKVFLIDYNCYFSELNLLNYCECRNCMELGVEKKSHSDYQPEAQSALWSDERWGYTETSALARNADEFN